MSQTIIIKELISSKSADDDVKGNSVFMEIKNRSKENGEDIILDFRGIELINTAFLNNAIGQLFNREIYDLSRNKVKVCNMQVTMLDLLKESISVANQKYS